MELRIKAGDPARVEDYLAVVGGSVNEDWLSEMIQAEFNLRCRFESHAPEYKEYSTRFPGQYTRLLETILQEKSGNDPSVNSAFIESDISRFEKRKIFEQGGLGTIWIAFDKQLDREVALKELKVEFAGDVNLVNRFRREVDITSSLDHPGIVPVYGCGKTEDGRPFYAMKLIRGTTLHQSISSFHEHDWKSDSPGESKQVAFTRLLRHFINVCDTIHFAHQHGILHRDIKPQNVMLGANRETIVLDWGLAKAYSIDRNNDENNGSAPVTPEIEPWTTDDTLSIAKASEDTDPHVLFDKVSDHSSEVTKHGTAIGTPGFMSPEQQSGDHTSTRPASDIYSLGATLFKIVKGPDESESNLATSSRDQNVLTSIVAKAMQPSAETRYPSASQIARDVEKFLADESIQVHRETLFEKTSRLLRKHSQVAATTTAALLALSLISGVFFVRSNYLRSQAVEASMQAEKGLDLTMRLFTKRRDPYTSHMDSTQEYIAECRSIAQEATSPRVHAKLLLGLGTWLNSIEEYEESVTTIEEVQELYRNNNLNDPELLLDTHVQISEAYRRAGYFQDAFEHGKIALEIGKTSLAPSKWTFNNILASLSSTCSALNYDQRAIDFAEQLYQHLKEYHPDNNEQIAIAQLHLSAAYAGAGKKNPAKPPLQLAIETVNNGMLAPSSRSVDVEKMVANDLIKNAKYLQAAKKFRQILDKELALMGERSQRVFGTIKHLSEAHIRYGIANPNVPNNNGIVQLEKLVDEFRSRGPDSPITYKLQSELAKAYKHFGRKSHGDSKTEFILKGIEIIQNAIAECDASRLGKHNQVSLDLMKQLARDKFDANLADQGLNSELKQEALNIYSETQSVYEKLFQESKQKLVPQNYCGFLTAYSTDLFKAKRFRESYEVRNRLLEIKSCMLGEDHCALATHRAHLANCETGMGNNSSALLLLTQSLQMLDKQIATSESNGFNSQKYKKFLPKIQRLTTQVLLSQKKYDEGARLSQQWRAEYLERSRMPKNQVSWLETDALLQLATNDWQSLSDVATKWQLTNGIGIPIDSQKKATLFRAMSDFMAGVVSESTIQSLENANFRKNSNSEKFFTAWKSILTGTLHPTETSSEYLAKNERLFDELLDAIEAGPEWLEKYRLIVGPLTVIVGGQLSKYSSVEDVQLWQQKTRKLESKLGSMFRANITATN